MKTIELVQGSKEWLAHRALHDNASDAPAMMGVSPYKTRSELLKDRHTGLTAEISSATQTLFDDGHKFEALARPIAEDIADEELYPVVGTLGNLSASFDGVTLGGDVIFEHKTLNDAIRKATCAEELPEYLRVQMEQQLHVSSAERCIFVASKWSRDDELIEEVHHWYKPDMALRARIIAGWAQFHIDLENYAPAEVVPEVAGRTPETLPALRIEVTGMVTASNLADFKEHALTVFNGINRELTTDQQFADAEKAVKWCGDVEERLKAAKQHALSQTESIDALFRTIDDISAEARRVRLDLDKLVSARKESLREEIRQGALAALRQHYIDINSSLSMGVVLGVPVAFGSDVATAMKGKKTIASLRDAADTTLANTKIEADKIADRVRKNIAILQGAFEYAFLFSDGAQLAVSKETETLELMVKSRINDHKAAELKKAEEIRAAIAEEERIKAEAKVRAEQAAIVEANRKAEADRAATERYELDRKAKEEAAATLQARPAESQQREDARQAELAGAVLQQRSEADKRVTYPSLTAESAGIIAEAAIKSATTSAPTLTLGQIAARLGFNLSADFLRSIGFEAAESKGSAKLYHESSWRVICAELIVHIRAASEDQQKAA